MSKNSSAVLLSAGPDASVLTQSTDSVALENAFTALASYDHGSPRGLVLLLDEAVRSSLTNAGRRAWLEQRLLGGLGGNYSAVAKEYICNQLVLIGSAQSVPVLAGLLGDLSLSQAARMVLEAMPFREASEALRTALPKLSGQAKIGVINSLRVRRDEASVPALAPLLADPESVIASAAAAALGEIGTGAAAQALAGAAVHPALAVRRNIADARLVCAERLLAAGHSAEAMQTYKALNSPEQDKPVQLAAKKGLLEMLRAK